MNPNDYCQEKVAASGSSFYYSFLFLDPPRRQAIMAFYAFCREVDDAVDNCENPDIAQAKLAWWRMEIGALYEGSPSHPVTRALAESLQRHALPQQQLLEIIDGMEMDVHQGRYTDFRELQHYCHRAAGVVGQITAEILGCSDTATQEYAHELGLALQLTNIIRDVGEDARRGRIYLPLDELARFGVSEDDILDSRYSDGFRRLMAFQAERAYGYYDRALAKLPAQDRKPQRAGLIMAAVYRTLLDEIVGDGYRVLDRHLSLTPVRKLWIATRTWLAN